MRRLVIAAGVLVLVAGCLGGSDYTQPPPPLGDGGSQPDGGGPDGGGPDAGWDAGIVPRSDGGNLTVGEWNLEFFGKTDAGPSDDALQAANVATVMGQQNADIWALEEVCDESRLGDVLNTLSSTYGEQYVAIYPDTSSVSNPYSGYGGSWGQKTTLLFRKGMASEISADLVYNPDHYGTTTPIDSSWPFAARDPLEVHLQLTTDAGTQDLWVVVVHLKSGSSSWSERVTESNDLKTYLDEYHPNDRLMVVGDWNDDLNMSIDGTDPSPFQNFVGDSANYEFPTIVFTQSGTATTVKYPNAIDHHLISNELFGNLIDGSQRVVHPSIPSYGTTTSDHYPTVVEYRLP